MYTPFDISIIVGAICGLIMVAGSIWLLRIGIIDLKEKIKDSEDKDAIHFAIKEIKLSTRYPALGLFIIGGCFVLGSAYLSKEDVRQIPIYGQIAAQDNSYLSDVRVRILLEEFNFPVNQQGEANYILLYAEEPSNLRAELIAPGYIDHEREIPLTRNIDGSWAINYELGKIVARKPTSGLKTR